MFLIKTLNFPIAIFSLMTLLISGCGKDDPISPHEEHFEPEGLVIIDSGVRFFRYFRGQIDTSEGREDELEAPVGLGPHWRIRFLDDHGDEIDAPDDPDYKFGWRIADSSVLEVHQDGKFDFHLRGLKEGHTTIEFQVIHIDHVDFRTIPIPVHVHHEEGEHGEPVGLKLEDEETHTLLAQVSLAGEGAKTDTMTVRVGQTTDHIEVKFIDDEDREFQPEAPPHALGFAVADTSVIGIDPPDAAEPWAFRIIGKKAGSTTLTLSILHDDHVEETFAPILVQVISP